LYSAGVPLGNPATANVRNGTTYGASGELTGTLIVPLPSQVVDGVPFDSSSVGTYSTTPEAISTELFTKLLSHPDFDVPASFGSTIKNVDCKLSDIKKNTDLIPAAV
jgi:hypothetical protein